MWRLGRRDLLHEWILSLCLMTAIAGVLAPLLVLFGLKTGVIEAMRAELVEDPVFREITPAETRNYPPEFFADIRNQPETEFMVESVLRGASVIRVEAGGDKVAALDMLPTGPGDPLLSRFSISAPALDEVVLTTKAAEMLTVTTGEAVELFTSRTEGGRRRQARQASIVVGILPPRADTVERVYVPLQLALDIESFREGFSIPDRGWPGRENLVKPVVDGLIVGLDRHLDAVERADLLTNTGFFRAEVMSANEFNEQFGQLPPDRPVLLNVSVIDRAAPMEAVTRVRRKLSGFSPIIRPYVRGMNMDVAFPGGSSRPVTVTADVTGQLEDGWLLLPDDLKPREIEVGTTIRLIHKTVAGPIEFEMRYAGPTKSQDLVLPVSVMGVLRRGAERGLVYDPSTKRFSMLPPGYRGFRLYAKSIDDVQSLQRKLDTYQVESLSHLDAILRIQALDSGLTRIFLLIAGLAIVTGTLVLLSSQYGAVERKRSVLAHLRLIGFSRNMVAWFPISQGLLIAAASGMSGLVLAYGAQELINSQFAVPLGFEQKMCVIEPEFAASATLVLVCLSLVIALVAARRAMLVDPAEGLRDE